jgi:uncharacterized membrane protein
MTPSRLEAFSDGVFSIAATLLVLELHVPAPDERGLAVALARQWPAYAVYAVSFMTIGIMWVNHHALFALVRRVDRPLLFLNLLLLLAVAVVPFPTAVLGQYLGSEADSHVAATVYGLVMVLNALGWGAIWTYVTRDARLLVEHVPVPSARATVPRFVAGLAFYLLGVAAAGVSAQLSLLMYALVAVYYVLPTLPRAGSPAGGTRRAPVTPPKSDPPD